MSGDHLSAAGDFLVGASNCPDEGLSLRYLAKARESLNAAKEQARRLELLIAARETEAKRIAAQAAEASP